MPTRVPKIKVVLFDLDNTLYPPGGGLFADIDRRIVDYVRRRLGIDEAAAAGVRRRLRDRYHITLCGLMAEHGIDPEEYLAFVHDVPVEQHLSADPALAGLLDGIDRPRHIFTNGSLDHARRVLAALGVADRFGAVFDIAFTGYVPKPEPAAYLKVAEALGVAPEEILHVDDLPANVAAAERLGMTCILFSPRFHHAGSFHRHAADRDALRRLLSELLGR